MNLQLDSEYWNDRYLNNEFGWDIGYVSTPLKNYIDVLTDKNLKILIPGAGNSYEAEYLFNLGFKNVYLCDYAEEPLKNFLERVPNFPKENLLQVDFFELEGHKFDLVLEQTFFCAITPMLRTQYFEKMSEILTEKGILAGVLFNDVLNNDKPPYGGHQLLYYSYFKKLFQIKVFEKCYHSVPARAGRELFHDPSKTLMDHITQRQLFLKHVAQTSDTPLLGLDVNIAKAKGITLTDVHGKEYIDLISGISVSNVGHCHPEVVEAIKQQSEKYMHLMVYGEFNQTPQVTYAKLLCSVLPPSLNSVYYTTSGSESIEGAMKLAKRSTGRAEIISFKNSYHGSTQGALSLMGDESFKNAFRPLLPGTKQLEFNNIDQLKEITTSTAAVVIEPIQGEAGVRVGDENFIKALEKKCKEVGALLIFDEIQTGFGRTGTLFVFERYNIVPDVLCIAKGMGGGLPIGAFVASKELMGTLSHDPILGHINTFGGNAVCVAAAEATLKIIIRDKLHLRANEIETIIRKILVHPKIKGLRVIGALGAIDFGTEEQNLKICKFFIENGIITDWFLFCPTALRIAPPLTITNEELERVCIRMVRNLGRSLLNG